MNLIKNSLAQLFVCVVVRCVATWCMLDDWVSVVQLDELTEHAPGLSVRTPSARLHCMPPCKCDTVHDRFVRLRGSHRLANTFALRQVYRYLGAEVDGRYIWPGDFHEFDVVSTAYETLLADLRIHSRRVCRTLAQRHCDSFA